MQTVGIILFWIVIIELFVALNIWLGSLAYSWYQKRKEQQKKSDE